MKAAFTEALTERFGRKDEKRTVPVELGGGSVDMPEGAVVVAAITSCTNTSNPSVMLGAGMMARNAAAKGSVRTHRG